MAIVLACGVQVNLSDNQLCGMDDEGEGTYTAEGITALADAVSVSASLTSVNVSYNRLDEREKQLLRDTLKGRVGLNLQL